MPRLTKIYTKTGDDGTTGLGDGSRVPKCDRRVTAYGDVDEASAVIGVAAACVVSGDAPFAAEIVQVLRNIQNDLLDLGADLCVPIVDAEAPTGLRIKPEQVSALEEMIDRFNEPLGPLENFILPGGTPLASALHMARTVTRRAERNVVELACTEPAAVNPCAVQYLNRLSDLLFVLARRANDGRDILWRPGGLGGPQESPKEGG